MEWKEFLESINESWIKYRKEQEEFYLRTTNFLSSESDILVNPGGMGLGKTLATTKTILDYLNNFNFFFIANPTALLKEVWADNLNLTLIKDYIIWFAKPDMCIKKGEDHNFDVYKNCNDDCKYAQDLWSDKELLPQGQEMLATLKLPTTPEKYYKEYGTDDCLLYPCRYGLKTRKVLIGDFFGAIIPRMFNLVTNNRNKGKACLIVDEAHLLPYRTKDYLSKELSFDRAIRELKNATSCDYVIRINKQLITPFEDSIKTLEKIRWLLIERTNKEKDKIISYTYSEFKRDYSLNKTLYSFNFEELKLQLNNLLKYKNEDVEEDPENEKESYIITFLNFLKKWEEKEADKNYSNYFQYSIQTKDKIKFFINCQDTSEYLFNCFAEWKKIILNSGTISDLEYFKHHMGLEKFNVKYENLLKSYSIKNDVIIYPIGKFTRKKVEDTNIIPREETYKNNKELLQEILKNLSGRTILYIQSKQDSKKIEEQIKELNIPFINFCIKDDGFETNKKDFEECMDKFNSMKYGIAIINILGRVEGHNFKDEDNLSVSNIIIYGYPFPKRWKPYYDELKYYTDILKDKTKARRWLDYVPVLDRIHQACMRAKRDETDKPIILLWDNQFGTGEKGYKYMPDDLKGFIIFNADQLINLIKEKDGRRKSSI